MKKATNKSKSVENDDMRPVYDFSGAVRGKNYKPLHTGYAVHIQRADGTTIVQQFKLDDGAVLLDPDVREVFPDSEAVNTALRLLITLMRQMPNKPRAGAPKKRSVRKQDQTAA